MSDSNSAGARSGLDPTLSTAAFVALETAINAALRYDPGSRLALARLEGQVLAVELTSPIATTLYIVPGGEALELHQVWQGECTTRLRGSLSALTSLIKSDTSTLANSGVEVMGSTALLSNLQRIMANLDLDWEEALSQLMGDVLGHQTAERLRNSLGWLGERAASGQRLMSEYLTEELQALPSQPELKAYFQQVDSLRMGLDRLSARVEQLRRAKQESNTP